jgi:hypothetical protein
MEGTTLNLNPTYSGWNSDFPEGCVTYTLRDNKGNNWDSTGIVVGSTYGSGLVDVTLTQTFYYNSTEIANRSIKVQVFNGLISTIEKNGQMLFEDDEGADTAIPAITLLLRKNAGVVTKTVTVNANPFPSSEGKTVLNFVPNTSGWNEDFPESGLTYTLTSTNPSKDLNSHAGSVPVGVYTNGDTPTFTQTFFYNAQSVGSRKIATEISLGRFDAIYDDDVNWNELNAIPSIVLYLEKPKNAGE